MFGYLADCTLECYNKDMNKDDDFDKLVATRRKWYYSVNEVHCRYLNEKVVFNNHGFKHILRDGRGHYRTKADAKMRLNLLTWAPVVIKTAIFMPSSEFRDADDKRNHLGKPVTFFEIQGTISHPVGKSKKKRYLEITVILRRIGDGNLHYYSIRYTKHGLNEISD